MYPGWIPAFDETLGKLSKYLEVNNFVEIEHTQEYRISVKMKRGEYQANTDGELILDEHFSLKYFYMPAIKWLVIDVIRCRPGDEKPYDMRFRSTIQIQTNT